MAVTLSSSSAGAVAPCSMAPLKFCSDFPEASEPRVPKTYPGSKVSVCFDFAKEVGASVYEVLIQDQSVIIVQFPDGTEGALSPVYLNLLVFPRSIDPSLREHLELMMGNLERAMSCGLEKLSADTRFAVLNALMEGSKLQFKDALIRSISGLERHERVKLALSLIHSRVDKKWEALVELGLLAPPAEGTEENVRQLWHKMHRVIPEGCQDLFGERYLFCVGRSDFKDPKVPAVFAHFFARLPQVKQIDCINSALFYNQHPQFMRELFRSTTPRPDRELAYQFGVKHPTILFEALSDLIDPEEVVKARANFIQVLDGSDELDRGLCAGRVVTALKRRYSQPTLEEVQEAQRAFNAKIASDEASDDRLGMASVFWPYPEVDRVHVDVGCAYGLQEFYQQLLSYHERGFEEIVLEFRGENALLGHTLMVNLRDYTFIEGREDPFRGCSIEHLASHLNAHILVNYAWMQFDQVRFRPVLREEYTFPSPIPLPLSDI
ncbi:MAG: hypothetical protein SP1CHLAM54_09320 [Chlamydiia bacterium]|nr:hypothetical protein [Chlamydiia bacterium]MCH9615838.1 hypothetical protein [Chlamydiia bacterium]MCH9628759.1 hypothetical protein [Chlamydiia bacterium]